jgi:hypothetical protein
MQYYTRHDSDNDAVIHLFIAWYSTVVEDPIPNFVSSSAVHKKYKFDRFPLLEYFKNDE